MLTRLARTYSNNTVTASTDAKNKISNHASKKLGLNMAERVLRERRVENICRISYTAKERVQKQLSTKTAHKIPPLSRNDNSTDEVKLLARRVLLSQRARASASYTDKNGIPILTPISGIGHFVLPLQRVVFTYCSHAKDSDGMREYLSKNLRRLAENDPGVEFVVEPRWGHFPLIRGFFLRGYSKVLCVKNFTAAEVNGTFMELRNSSGHTLQPFRQKVRSSAPAIRPIWSPFHMANVGKNDPLLSYRRK